MHAAPIPQSPRAASCGLSPEADSPRIRCRTRPSQMPNSCAYPGPRRGIGKEAAAVHAVVNHRDFVAPENRCAGHADRAIGTRPRVPGPPVRKASRRKQIRRHGSFAVGVRPPDRARCAPRRSEPTQRPASTASIAAQLPRMHDIRARTAGSRAPTPADLKARIGILLARQITWTRSAGQRSAFGPSLRMA